MLSQWGDCLVRGPLGTDSVSIAPLRTRLNAERIRKALLWVMEREKIESVLRERWNPRMGFGVAVTLALWIGG